MVYQCAIFGCSNKSQDGVSLHGFPTSKFTKQKWINFVNIRRKYWKCTKSSRICSVHFREQDFTNLQEFKLGFASLLFLKQGSIPSIQQSAIESSTENEPSTQRAGHRKREVLRIIDEYDEKEQEVIGNDLENDLEEKENCTRSVGTQCYNYEFQKCHKFVQASVKTKEKGLQHVLETSDAKCGPSAFPNFKNSDVFEETVDPGSDHEMDYGLNDPEYIPTEDDYCMMEAENSNCYPYNETKYIVTKSKLWELLQRCTKCNRTREVTVVNEMGTYIKTQQKCHYCEEAEIWDSQPKVNHIPVVNIQLAAAILFSGNSPAKVLRLLNFINLKTISRSTYDHYQNCYLQPTIMTHWTAQQLDMFEQLKQDGTSLILGGDGRCDSPGHCAKYGTFSMMELRLNKIIDVQLIQSNEVGGSCRMELEGFIRSFEAIEGEGLKIDQFIGDRHPQIQKEAKSLIQQKRLRKKLHDSWHVVKGTTKKVLAVSKLKDCGLVLEWIKSISNHMYWSVTSSEGNGDLAAAKWKSITNHLQNIHAGHDDVLYPECSHPPVQQRRKKWLAKGSKAIVKLEEILLATRLIEDIKSISPNYQTSNLEGYHSLMLQFAPKYVSYSFKGMLIRTLLAAIHYNENSGRIEVDDEEGLSLIQVYFPKSKKGGYSIKPKRTPATYNYADELMELLLTKVVYDPLPYQVHINNINVPAPLSSQYFHPTKEQAAETYTTRLAAIKKL